MKSGAWSIVMKKSQYFILGGKNDKWQKWNWWGKSETAVQKGKMGNSKRCRYRQDISLCIETGLSVRSKMWFLPKIFVLPLDSAFLLAMITPTIVHGFMLGVPFQQARAARPAVVGVVELVRARWHTGYVGESPPRTSFHIQQGLGWMKLSLRKQLSVSLKKQSNWCFQWRQHQCFAF